MCIRRDMSHDQTSDKRKGTVGGLVDESSLQWSSGL